MTTPDPLDALADRVAGKLAARFAQNTATPGDDHAELEAKLMQAVGSRITDNNIEAALAARVGSHNPFVGATGISPDAPLNDSNLEANLARFLNK